jgi:hypothetical protein
VRERRLPRAATRVGERLTQVGVSDNCSAGIETEDERREQRDDRRQRPRGRRLPISPRRGNCAGASATSARTRPTASARPEDAGRRREHDVLDEQQTHEPSAGRAERHAHRQVLPAVDAPRHQHPRHVRAGPEQHERDRAEQHEQHRADRADDARLERVDGGVGAVVVVAVFGLESARRWHSSRRGPARGHAVGAIRATTRRLWAVRPDGSGVRSLGTHTLRAGRVLEARAA